MTLLEDVTKSLQEKGLITSFYRFQGVGSYPYIQLENSQLTFLMQEKYTYLSRTEEHHRYYAYKKLRSYLIRSLRDEKETIIPPNFKLASYCERVKEQINLQEDLKQIHSYKISLFPGFETLLKENAILNHRKISGNNVPEVTDVSRHGGAYGLKEEWLSLLFHFSLITVDYHLDQKTILFFLNVLHKKALGLMKQKEAYQLNHPAPYSYSINEEIFSPYTKYQIMELLEQIIEKEKCPKHSSLLENPRESIHNMINLYEEFRQTALQTLEKTYQKHL